MSSCGREEVTLDYVETNPNDIPDSVKVDTNGKLPRHCVAMVVKQSVPVVLPANNTAFKFYALPTIRGHYQIVYSTTADGATFASGGNDMDNATNLTTDFSAFVFLGQGIRFVPSANSNNDNGEIVMLSNIPTTPVDATALAYAQLSNLAQSSTMMQQRGFVKGPARGGLEVVGRPCAYSIPYFETGYTGSAPPATRVAHLRQFQYFPKAMMGVNYYPDQEVWNVNPTTFGSHSNRYRDLLPALLVSGNGFPSSGTQQQVGTIEMTSILCCLAANKAVASHVEMPVYLGGPLVDGSALSNGGDRKAGIFSTIVAKVQKKAERVKKVLNTAGAIMQGASPFLGALNPGLGAAALTAGTTIRGLSSMGTRDLASDLVGHVSNRLISSVRNG